MTIDRKSLPRVSNGRIGHTISSDWFSSMGSGKPCTLTCFPWCDFRFRVTKRTIEGTRELCCKFLNTMPLGIWVLLGVLFLFHLKSYELGSNQHPWDKRTYPMNYLFVAIIFIVVVSDTICLYIRGIIIFFFLFLLFSLILCLLLYYLTWQWPRKSWVTHVCTLRPSPPIDWSTWKFLSSLLTRHIVNNTDLQFYLFYFSEKFLKRAQKFVNNCCGIVHSLASLSAMVKTRNLKWAIWRPKHTKWRPFCSLNGYMMWGPKLPMHKWSMQDLMRSD